VLRPEFFGGRKSNRVRGKGKRYLHDFGKPGLPGRGGAGAEGGILAQCPLRGRLTGARSLKDRIDHGPMRRQGANGVGIFGFASE